MPHLCEAHDSFRGILSRNTTYRPDARNRLRGTGIYNNAAAILAGIQKRDRMVKRPNTKLIRGLTQQERVPGYYLDYQRDAKSRKNFAVGYLPYTNQAHHVVVCEVFYDEKWTAQHLEIVLASGYNINNPENIIYLPQCCGATYKRDYHNLPDHSSGHSKYNERLVGEADAVFDLVDKAANEPDCEKQKDLRKQIFDKLKQIEKANFRFIRALGARPLK